jgi:hypothetical protein
MDRRISTRKYVFKLFGGAINWMRKIQAVVALSTIEFEYMETTHASKEEVWLQRLCSGIGLVQQDVRIDCDIQSTMFLAKNLVYHSKKKHIDIQYHVVRDMVEEKKVLLMKVEEHLNTFNNVVSQLVSVEIKISDEDKCISLLFSLQDSWDSLVVAIGSNTTALMFDEVVSSFFIEDMRQKNMEG